jgi:hypothetical protein
MTFGGGKLMRRISSRYRVALVAAIFLIAAGWLFVRHYSIESVLERAYEDSGEVRYLMTFDLFKAWGKPDLALDSSESVQISEFLDQHRLFSVLAAFAICFAIAFLLGLRQRNSSNYGSTSSYGAQPQTNSKPQTLGVKQLLGRISRKYRIAFVTAAILIVGGWGYAHYYRYDREQAIKRYGDYAVETFSKDGHGPRPPEWQKYIRSQIHFSAPRDELWTWSGFAMFLEEHPWRMVLTTFVGCIGLPYTCGTVQSLRRWNDARVTRRLLAEAERLRQSIESRKNRGP